MSTKEVWELLREVRAKKPLVHNITNFVVMNNTANALLAVGASPIMAHAIPEVKDMVNIVNSLVINIGTLEDDWVTAMLKAMLRAQELEKPIVLDPVGAGATPYRTDTVKHLISQVAPTVIRGNASEIMALYTATQTRGVDSTESAESALEAGRFLNQKYNAIICISGAVDYIISQNQLAKVHNGHEMMTLVTGMGCTATALHGAFLGITQDDFKASIATMSIMGVAGEIAQEKSAGPGSLQMNFLDTLYSLNQEDLESRLRLEVE